MIDPDALIAGFSTSVVEPDKLASILNRLDSTGQDKWPLDEFRSLTKTKSVAELIYNSAFVRLSAKRRSFFFIGADSMVHRQQLVVNVDSQCAVGFFFKPPWFDDLKAFVDAGDSVLLIGPPGSGKTLACEKLFKDRGQELQIVSCTPSMTADDIEGRVELRNDHGVPVTVFEPAALAAASKSGAAVLLDEADAVPASASFGLFRLLDRRDMRIQRLGEAGVIPRHQDFRIVGTQNTEGRGDESGLHHGRSYQDEAFLDRWDNVIRVTYPSKADEMSILTNSAGICDVDAERIVDGASLLRSALADDKIMFCCTIRRTLAVARNLVRGLDPQRAWHYAVINRSTREDARRILEIISRVYGGSWK